MPVKRDARTGRFTFGGRAEQVSTGKPITLKNDAEINPQFSQYCQTCGTPVNNTDRYSTWCPSCSHEHEEQQKADRIGSASSFYRRQETWNYDGEDLTIHHIRSKAKKAGGWDKIDQGVLKEVATTTANDSVLYELRNSELPYDIQVATFSNPNTSHSDLSRKARDLTELAISSHYFWGDERLDEAEDLLGHIQNHRRSSPEVSAHLQAAKTSIRQRTEQRELNMRMCQDINLMWEHASDPATPTHLLDVAIDHSIEKGDKRAQKAVLSRGNLSVYGLAALSLEGSGILIRAKAQSRLNRIEETFEVKEQERKATQRKYQRDNIPERMMLHSQS